MWNLPRPGIKPMSPPLAGGFLSTSPPEKFRGRVWSVPGCVLFSWSSPLLTGICVRTSERGESHSMLTVCCGWKAFLPFSKVTFFVSRRQDKEAASDIRAVSIRSQWTCGRAAEGFGMACRDYVIITGATEEGQGSRNDPDKASPLPTHHQGIHPFTHSEAHAKSIGPSLMSLGEFGPAGRQGMAFWSAAGGDWVRKIMFFFLITILSIL